jgi:adenylate cyclase
MRPRSPLARRAIAGAGIGAAAAGLAIALGAFDFTARVEDATYDIRVRRTARQADASSPIVIVDINESSMNRLEPIFGRWPWPRLVHAAAIDYIKASGARAIAYDVIFSGRDERGRFTVNGREISGEVSDLALVESVRSAGNVVLAVDPSSEGLADTTKEDAGAATLPGTVYSPGPGFQQRRAVDMPFPELAAAAAGLGHTLLIKERDGSARRMLPFIEHRSAAIPALGIAAVLVAERDSVGPADVKLEGNELRIGTTIIPLLSRSVPPSGGETEQQPSRQALLRFPATTVKADGSGAAFTTFPFFDVLVSGDQQSEGKAPAVPPSAFRDKIVFVGLRVANTNENFATPLGGGGSFGVDLHATLADNVLASRFMRRSGGVTDAAIVLVAGLGTGLVATMLPVLWAITLSLAATLALAVALTLAVGNGVWIALAQPVGAASLALFGGVAWQYFVEERAKREMKGLFGRYVSKHVIDQLIADPSLARLGGHQRDMSVLFSDIRGFTAASENATPEAVVDQLNEYFSAMVDVLFRHDGTLDKFVGDMVMGLFGAPLDDPKHADHAVACALEMISELERLNVKWRAEGRAPLGIGIGINSGPMIAGNIGAPSAMSYTVIGDTVNLGSRIESANKELGTRVLISEATRSRLTIPVNTRQIGEIKVKGRAQAVMLYELISAE